MPETAREDLHAQAAGEMPLGAGWAHLLLEADGGAEFFADDIRDLYHALAVSDKRVSSNHLLGEWPADGLRGSHASHLGHTGSARWRASVH